MPASLVSVSPPTITATELAALGDVTVLDLADSARYRRGHVPGAWWAIRARLDEVTGVSGQVVLTSPDGQLAGLAHADAHARWPGAQVLEGGTAAWSRAGYPLEEGLTRLTTETDDAWFKPYDAEDEAVARQRMQDYLDWEVALLDQVERDELVQFRHYPAG